jgi:hypothetical protein
MALLKRELYRQVKGPEADRRSTTSPLPAWSIGIDDEIIEWLKRPGATQAQPNRKPIPQTMRPPTGRPQEIQKLLLSRRKEGGLTANVNPRPFATAT